MEQTHTNSKYLKKHKRAKKENIYLNILYEDEKIIVCNKSSGLLTIKNDKTDKCMYHMVYTYLKKMDKHNQLFIVHRLDKETSGIVIFAKDFKTKSVLQKAFEERKVDRYYEALVVGKIESDKEIILKNYLFFDKFNNVFVSNKKTEDLAITKFRLVSYDKKNNRSTLAIKIETGKKNQIRAQLANIDHPIVGDKKYDSVKAPRMMLNAYKLSFPSLKNYLKVTEFKINTIFIKE